MWKRISITRVNYIVKLKIKKYFLKTFNNKILFILK
jgi:hypothetical protein